MEFLNEELPDWLWQDEEALLYESLADDLYELPCVEVLLWVCEL